jgi:hypothetical protein
MIPKCPFKITDKPEFLIGGGAGRYLKQLINTKELKEEVLQSIKQTKKGMPRPGKEQLDKATKEFVAHITSPEPSGKPQLLLEKWGDFVDYEDVSDKIEFELNEGTVKAQLERTVVEIFGNKNIPVEQRIKATFPSCSANYIDNRKNAGSVGTILEHPTLLAGLRKPEGYLKIEKIKKIKRYLIREIDEYGDYFEQEREEVEEEEEYINNEENSSQDKGNRYIIDEEGLNHAYETLWHRMIKEASEEVPNVRPVALAEALKIRMITAMPPIQQTVLQNLMRVIRKKLLEFKIFKLTGEPVSEEIMLNSLGSKLEDDDVYLSGDYMNATDNFKTWVSETIANQLAHCTHISNIESHLLIKALTRHIIEGKAQSRGQLMGSIASFPILCIANAAMSRWACELADKRVYKLNDTRILINGDDVALRAHKSVYKFWKLITTFMGLEESVGKTYVSREFVDINSTSFTRVADHEIVTRNKNSGEMFLRKCPFKLTKYVNLGLMFGIKRSGQKVSMKDLDDPSATFGARARELLRLSPTHLKTKIMKVFFNEHRELIEKTRLPAYIPEWLGGLGIPYGPWGEPSELDLRVAHRILINWKRERPISIAHQGTTWKTWALAEKKIPEPIFTIKKGKFTDEYNSLVGKKCIDLLFDSNMRLTDMFGGIDSERDVSKAIERNAKLWKPNRQGMEAKLPKPILLEKLEFIAQYANYHVDDSETIKIQINQRPIKHDLD